MSYELVELDERELQEFADALETFKNNIQKHCDNMDTRLAYCNRYMIDETSQSLIRKANQTVLAIRESIKPTTYLYERIYDTINYMRKNDFTQ